MWIFAEDSYAQSNPIQTFYKLEMLRISREIYKMAMNGEMIAYRTDSLASSYSKEAMKRVGSTEMWIDIPAWRTESAHIEDTTYVELFNKTVNMLKKNEKL